MTMTAAERLKTSRQKAGFGSASDAARSFGWQEPAYRHHENGTRGFDADTARKYGRAFKVRPGWLLGFESSESGAEPSATRTEPASDAPRTVAAHAGDETVEIVQLDLSLPMGPGATVDDYIEETLLRFDLDYIRTFTRTPSNRLRLARGVGDSMHPTLVSSDLVWIDSTQTMLNQQDRVWAVSINGAAAIKRLRALKEGKVLVISDNPTIGNYEVDSDELLIGGRVIRFARDL